MPVPDAGHLGDCDPLGLAAGQSLPGMPDLPASPGLPAAPAVPEAAGPDARLEPAPAGDSLWPPADEPVSGGGL